MPRLRTLLVATVMISGALPGPAAAASPPATFADDFSTPLGDRWEVHGGSWEIVDGWLQGLGETDRLHVDTPSALDLAGAVAVVRGVTATNVSTCLDMTSLERVDKGIVLRWRGPDDGIWLGFRGLEADGLISDLTVAQAVDGVPTLYTPSHTVAIRPHNIGDTIHVCAGHLNEHHCTRRNATLE